MNGGGGLVFEGEWTQSSFGCFYYLITAWQEGGPVLSSHGAESSFDTLLCEEWSWLEGNSEQVIVTCQAFFSPQESGHHYH